MNIKHELKRLLWKTGYDISRIRPTLPAIASHLTRRKQILGLYEIDTVLDIGANSGQFAQQLTPHGVFSGKIPVTEEFHKPILMM